MFVGVFSGRSTRAATTRRAATGRMNTLRAACQNPSRNSPKTPTAVRVALRSTTPAPPSTAAPAIIQRERVETGCSLVEEGSKGVHQQARERREAPRRGVEHRDSLRRCRSLRRRVRAAGRAQAQCSQCRTAVTFSNPSRMESVPITDRPRTSHDIKLRPSPWPYESEDNYPLSQ